MNYVNSCDETMSSFECRLYTNDFSQWLQGVNQGLTKVGLNIKDAVGDSVQSFWNAFMSTTPGKIFGFIWDILTFLLYGVRSIILLIWNLIYSILNGFVQMFIQLMSTFTDLSVFMGSATSMFVSLFVLVLLIIGFQFLIRFFLGKYHYKKFNK